jgi:hypothetical protein
MTLITLNVYAGLDRGQRHQEEVEELGAGSNEVKVSYKTQLQSYIFSCLIMEVLKKGIKLSTSIKMNLVHDVYS